MKICCFLITVFLTLIERGTFTTIACVTRCGLLSSRMPLSSSTMAKCYQSIKPKLSLASSVKITVANEVSYCGVYFFGLDTLYYLRQSIFFFLLQRDVLVHMLCRSCTYNVNTNNKDKEGDVKKQKNRIKNNRRHDKSKKKITWKYISLLYTQINKETACVRYHQELRPRDISPAVHELVSPAEKEGAMGSQRINTHIKALAWSKMDSPDPVKWYFDPWQ